MNEKDLIYDALGTMTGIGLGVIVCYAAARIKEIVDDVKAFRAVGELIRQERFPEARHITEYRIGCYGGSRYMPRRWQTILPHVKGLLRYNLEQ